MKKILLFLICVFAFVAFANAQKVYTLANDTLTDAETVYTVPVQSSSSKGAVTLQIALTNISGTTAGTITLQGSIDNSNYAEITNIADMFNVIPDDTITVADGTVGQAIIQQSPFKYYRWKYVGSGTQSTKIEQAYLPKLK